MKSLIFIIVGLLISWVFIDLESPDMLQHTVSPLSFILFLCALVTWLVIKADILDKPSGNSSGSVGDSGSSGGDGGC